MESKQNELTEDVWPTVTIAIPTYNRAHFLIQAIESALAQDYDKIEVVVSDNGSTDDTPEIVKRYRHFHNFRYHRSPVNYGPQYNWTKLLYEFAQGDWIMILGDDDYLLDKSYISKCIYLIRKNRNVVLCHANLKVVNEEEGKVKITEKRCPQVVNGEWYFFTYKHGILIHITNCIFRRADAIKGNVFKEDTISGESELLGKLLLTGKVGFVNTVANVYRFHGGNDTFNASLERIIAFFKILENVYAYGLVLKGSDNARLQNWKRECVERFIKAWFFNLAVRRDKSITFRFLQESFRCYPAMFWRIYLNPKNLLGLALGFMLSKQSLKWLLGIYAKARMLE